MTGERSDDFLELGLLFMVTGFAGVLVGATILVLILEGGLSRPDWLTLVLGAVSVLGVMLFVVLIRRLHQFLTKWL